MLIGKWNAKRKPYNDTVPLSCVQTLLKSGEQCWSLAELVQAVVILAHCHSLCSFVFGCETNSDLVPLSKSPNGSPPTFCLFDAANGNTNVPQSPANPTERITRRRVTNQTCVFLYWTSYSVRSKGSTLYTKNLGQFFFFSFLKLLRWDTLNSNCHFAS